MSLIREGESNPVPGDLPADFRFFCNYQVLLKDELAGSGVFDQGWS